MAVVEILKEIEDSRKGSNQAIFNGYLEDFLNVTENQALKEKLQPDSDAVSSIDDLYGISF